MPADTSEIGRNPEQVQDRMSKTRACRGGTLVEAAVTILIFLTFILAILEFGRAYNIYQITTNAAREGARFAVAPCPKLESACTFGAGSLPSSAAVQAKVEEFLNSGGIQDATVSVTPTTQTVSGVNMAFTRVDVIAPYSFVYFPFGTVNLKAEAVMRNETN